MCACMDQRPADKARRSREVCRMRAAADEMLAQSRPSLTFVACARYAPARACLRQSRAVLSGEQPCRQVWLQAPPFMRKRPGQAYRGGGSRTPDLRFWRPAAFGLAMSVSRYAGPSAGPFLQDAPGPHAISRAGRLLQNAVDAQMRSSRIALADAKSAARRESRSALFAPSSARPRPHSPERRHSRRAMRRSWVVG